MPLIETPIVTAALQRPAHATMGRRWARQALRCLPDHASLSTPDGWSSATPRLHLYARASGSM
jgi:hypothetical protein